MRCPRCFGPTFRGGRYCARFCGWSDETDVAPHLSGGWSEIDREEYVRAGFATTNRRVRGASRDGGRL